MAGEAFRRIFGGNWITGRSGGGGDAQRLRVDDAATETKLDWEREYDAMTAPPAATEPRTGNTASAAVVVDVVAPPPAPSPPPQQERVAPRLASISTYEIVATDGRGGAWNLVAFNTTSHTHLAIFVLFGSCVFLLVCIVLMVTVWRIGDLVP